jgi:adenylate kinase family enzyme
MERLAIVGITGSGKTTLGERLAARLGYPLVDLDAIHWGPNWTPAPRDEFRARVAAALAGPTWVTAGNYSKVRDIIWARADTLVWLDYPLGVSLVRLFRRTVGRIVTREELWAGNRESWRGQFASRDSLFLYALRTHRRRREEFVAALATPQYAHLAVLRFHFPAEADAWLNSLRSYESPRTDGSA